MSQQRFLLFCVLCFVCFGSCQEEPRALLYGRPYAPSPYVELARAPKNHGVVFTIALKQRNLDRLEEVLFQVSDPKHELYGKHWTREQVLDLVAPFEEDVAPVLQWLRDTAGSEALKIENRRDALKISTSVGVAERLFQTRLVYFRDNSKPKSHAFIKFMGQFSIPTSVTSVIDMVTGLTEFPPNSFTPKVVVDAENGTNSCNTPYTLKKIYNMSETLTISNNMATQGPFSRDAHQTKTIGFGESDLQEWEELNNLPVVPVSSIIGDAAYLYGPDDSSLAGGEALLDIQMMMGFAPGANTSFWIISDWIYEFANEILSTPGAPLVNSMSYGYEEINQCDITNCTALGFPDSITYIQRTDAEFMKCGVSGYTVLAASGDNGVEPNRDCTQMFQVYPASSLYVTTVGATAVIKSDSDDPIGSDAPPICDQGRDCDCSTSQVENGAMHTNAALFDTGGGFSHYNPRPTWQDYAVQQYFNSGVGFPDQKYWNSTNRGYPDVAACGADIAVYQKGKINKLAGTSASCPIWAAILNMLNSDRIDAGKSPLGFANPLLYSMWQENPRTFNDITVGHNGGNHYIGIGACNKFDFYATEGWDAVSGLGTPNFGLIREYVANLS